MEPRAATSSFRRNPDVATEVVGRELFLAHLGSGATYRLNATGRAIYELAVEGLDAAAIAARLHAGLGVSAERLERDARDLLAELARCSVIEKAP